MARKRKSNIRQGNRMRRNGLPRGSKLIAWTSGTSGAGVRCVVTSGTNSVVNFTDSSMGQWSMTKTLQNGA